MISRQIKRLQTLPQWQKTAAILIFAQFVSSLGFSNVFPFLPYYLKDLGTHTGLSTEYLVGLVYTGQATMMMIASPIWGGLADRFGRKLMVERAMFGGAVVFLLMGFVRSAEELIALRAIQGIVTGVVAAVNALLVATVPREKVGTAIGWIQVSRWSGVALGPLMGGVIADTFGFRPTFFVTAAFLLLAGVLVWTQISEDFVPQNTASSIKSSFWTDWQHILKTKGVAITYFVEFLNTLSRMVFLPLIPLFVELLLGSSEQASSFTGLILGLSSASGTLSAIYFGRIGDRIGHRRVLVWSVFSAAGFYFMQAFVIAPWQLLALQLLSGLALGGILPTLGALLAKFTIPGEEGAVYGLDNSIRAAARAIAPMVGASIAVMVNIRGSIIATAMILFITGFVAISGLPKLQSMPEKTGVL